jgi:hypothetical protein
MSILTIIMNALPSILSTQSIVDILSCLFSNNIISNKLNNSFSKSETVHQKIRSFDESHASAANFSHADTYNISNKSNNNISIKSNNNIINKKSFNKSPSINNLNKMFEDNIPRHHYKHTNTSEIIFKPLITVCNTCTKPFSNYIYCANDNYYCSENCRNKDIVKIIY